MVNNLVLGGQNLQARLVFPPEKNQDAIIDATREFHEIGILEGSQGPRKNQSFFKRY